MKIIKIVVAQYRKLVSLVWVQSWWFGWGVEYLGVCALVWGCLGVSPFCFDDCMHPACHVACMLEQDLASCGIVVFRCPCWCSFGLGWAVAVGRSLWLCGPLWSPGGSSVALGWMLLSCCRTESVILWQDWGFPRFFAGAAWEPGGLGTAGCHGHSSTVAWPGLCWASAEATGE